MTVNVPSVAVSSPVPGASSGSLITVVIVVDAKFVCLTPSTVLVASMNVETVAGIVFDPSTRRPRL